jgi:hypothetical protein
MANSGRPYVSAPIEKLEHLFETSIEDANILEEIVRELSFRKTRRARNLLAAVSAKIANFEPEPDGPEAGSEGEILSAEESKDEGAIYGKNDRSENSAGNRSAKEVRFGGDHPPDDRKKPEHLTLIRPVGTPGLPESWVRPLKTDRPLTIPKNAALPEVYVAALTARHVWSCSQGGRGRIRDT